MPEYLKWMQQCEDDKKRDHYMSTTVTLIGHRLQAPMEDEALRACDIVEYLGNVKKNQIIVAQNRRHSILNRNWSKSTCTKIEN